MFLDYIGTNFFIILIGILLYDQIPIELQFGYGFLISTILFKRKPKSPELLNDELFNAKLNFVRLFEYTEIVRTQLGIHIKLTHEISRIIQNKELNNDDKINKIEKSFDDFDKEYKVIESRLQKNDK